MRRTAMLRAVILVSIAAKTACLVMPPKVWLLLEELRVPYRVEKVPLNAYGYKPTAFSRRVDGGKLPALELDGELHVESEAIMDLLVATFGTAMDGGGDDERWKALEDDLMRDWFSLAFYPIEGERLEAARDALDGTLRRFDDMLGATPGPWALGGDAPSLWDNGPGYAVDDAKAASARIYGLDGAWELPLGDDDEGATRPPAAAAAGAGAAVTEGDVGAAAPEFDVVVLGGTLGVFAAAAFQKRGLKVCVVGAAARGRNQEWNLSLDEVYDLVEAGALEPGDVDGAVGSPGRYEVLAGGAGDLARRRRPERTACEASESGRVRRRGARGGETIAARLVVDAMGNASPIARQARREANDGADPKPSGICCVVGTLMRGFDADNSFGDLIYTNEDARVGGPDRQYFWEAFPAMSVGADARTTYLFTYMDADELREHTVLDQFEDYWDMLPAYQRHNAGCLAGGGRGDAVERAFDAGDLTLERCLFGLFPTFKDSPLPSRWDRVLAVGDASGVQSPLSFGGFGALTRHLGRVTDAVAEAVDAGALAKGDLAAVNGYAPNIAATWMFQRSFVHPVGSNRPAAFVNRLMRQNYENMEALGDDVLRPFNQDVVQPRALLRVLALATAREPLNIPALLFYIGPKELAEWLGHFGAMLVYDLLHHALGAPVRAWADRLPDARNAYRLRRLADAWEYGAGMDCGH
ncbi:hypothetical protein JL722_1566 [Aureococcus anophagefferens]|nr:hypothetical protein JL722_1566 [Aureococcus anophagefferens]